MFGLIQFHNAGTSCKENLTSLEIDPNFYGMMLRATYLLLFISVSLSDEI